MRSAIRRTATTAVILAGFALTGCGANQAPPDQIGLYYAAGSIDQNHFAGCIEPSTNGSWTSNDYIIWLPDNLRTWNIAAQGGDTNLPITVSSRPEPNQPSGVQVNVWSQTNLRLNTTCNDKADSVLVKFWETIGRRYGADTPDGWKAMMLNTVVPALEKAKRTIIRSYGADELVAGTVLPEAQQKVSAEFARELERLTGGKFFCGPAYVRGSDQCPDVEVQIKDVDYADPGIQQARNDKQKAIETAAAQVAEAEGRVRAAAAQNELYKNQAWVELEKARLQLAAVQACAANPNCTVILGGNASTLVQTK